MNLRFSAWLAPILLVTPAGAAPDSEAATGGGVVFGGSPLCGHEPMEAALTVEAARISRMLWMVAVEVAGGGCGLGLATTCHATGSLKRGLDLFACVLPGADGFLGPFRLAHCPGFVCPNVLEGDAAIHWALADYDGSITLLRAGD